MEREQDKYFRLGRRHHWLGFERPSDSFLIGDTRTQAMQAGWDSSKADEDKDKAWRSPVIHNSTG